MPCEQSATISNSDNVGPLESKTPLDGGKVEFNFIFYCVCVGGGDDKCVYCGHRCSFMIFMHMRVNILVLFTVGGKKTLHGYRFDVVEVAPKLLVLPCFHKLVTFRGKSLSD